MLKVYAPASIGNVSVGFDVLGASVTPVDGSLLGDCITIEKAGRFSLHCEGRFAQDLPPGVENNIVYQCWQRFCAELGQEMAVTLSLQKNMPIGSGLGSSACSVVAALLALNEYGDRPFDEHRLLLMMGELEGRISGSIHYDNVAPAYLGGMQLILNTDDIISQPVPGFEQWLWVMAYPGLKLSTAEARHILPAEYSRQQCIRHGRNLGGFIHACHTRQPLLAAELMEDVVGEPYRAEMIAGFSEAKRQMKERGALACGISGSGPTLFAISDNMQRAQELAGWLQQHYIKNDQGFVHICHLDNAGARRIE